MSDPEDVFSDPPSGCSGCVISVALVFVPGLVVSLLKGLLPAESWPIALFFGLLLATPFAYLVLSGTKARLPWGVAIILTVLLWGPLAVGIITNARDAARVIIGIEVLVALAFPFVITLGAWLASRRSRDVAPK